MISFTDDSQVMAPINYYYFCYYSEEEQNVCVSIVSIEYWNKYHRVDDHHLNIDDILPSFISEEGESHFFSTKSISETQKEFDFLGFKANDEFASFCREHDTSFYYPKDD